MAPDNPGSSAPAADEAAASVEGAAAAPATSNPGAASDPATTAGYPPAQEGLQGVASAVASQEGASIPPEGAPVEGAGAPEPQKDTSTDDLVDKVLEDRDDLEEGEIVEGRPRTAEEAAAPPDHPEPVPVGIGAIQDNVSEPGVEKTTTRSPDGDGLVTSEHVNETHEETEEDVQAYREKVMAQGDEIDAERDASASS